MLGITHSNCMHPAICGENLDTFTWKKFGNFIRRLLQLIYSLFAETDPRHYSFSKLQQELEACYDQDPKTTMIQLLPKVLDEVLSFLTPSEASKLIFSMRVDRSLSNPNAHIFFFKISCQHGVYAIVDLLGTPEEMKELQSILNKNFVLVGPCPETYKLNLDEVVKNDKISLILD